MAEALQVVASFLSVTTTKLGHTLALPVSIPREPVRVSLQEVDGVQDLSILIPLVFHRNEVLSKVKIELLSLNEWHGWHVAAEQWTTWILVVALALPMYSGYRAYKPSAPKVVKLSEPGPLAKVRLEYLSHTLEQQTATASLYEREEISSYHFDPTNPHHQARVQQILLQLGLDRVSRDSLDSRWSVQWSNSWFIGEDGDSRKRILFQWYLLLPGGLYVT